jgi:selenocysteine-specific elongation factor
MIVATAGHIDHGKTQLVRALSGVDTDRLPEEKLRGISIDLGFAYWRVGGTVVGFVDVPGHERFVRNMVAGVCAIDMALLVVAADDGVMPQTLEHLQILDLLGVRRGLAVVNKIDRVDARRVEEVTADVRSRLAVTSLCGISIETCSAMTGAGIERVAARLGAAARDARAQDSGGGHFRLAVDRAFTVDGAGTVVTGTVQSGSVVVGRRLCVSPGGKRVRVRGLRADGGPAEAAQAGQRCALNLAGVAVKDVARGDWIVDDAIHVATDRVDAVVTLQPGADARLSTTTRVHVHVGTADRVAQIAPLHEHVVEPGRRALAQIVFDRPIAALHGDRFIVRDSAGRRTLGGGRIVDPLAPRQHRRARERVAVVAAMAADSTIEVLQGRLACEGALDLDRFEQVFNLQPAEARALYASLDLYTLGGTPRFGMLRAVCDESKERVKSCLDQHHVERPMALGTPLPALLIGSRVRLPSRAFDALLHEMVAAGEICVTGGVAHLPKHDAADNPRDRLIFERVMPAMLDAGAAASTVAQLAADTGLDERSVRDMLYRRRASGAVYRVGKDRFYLRRTLASLAASAVALAKVTDGQFTAAQYRDAVGTGRTLAIEILECLDELGITVRVGEVRRICRDHLPQLGAASPLAVPAARAAGGTKPAEAGAGIAVGVPAAREPHPGRKQRLERRVTSR